MPRAKYQRTGVTSKVREILEKMSPEDRKDMSMVQSALAKGRVKASNQVVYGVRNQMKDGEAEETFSLKQLLAVQQTAKHVGGMESLKKIIRTIERVSE